MITPLRTVDQLVIAVAQLKRAAPNRFKEFETAFEAFWGQAVVQCVQSTSSEVFVSQGRARQLTELRDLFQNCIAAADNLEAKMKKEPH